MQIKKSEIYQVNLRGIEFFVGKIKVPDFSGKNKGKIRVNFSYSPGRTPGR